MDPRRIKRILGPLLASLITICLMAATARERQRLSVAEETVREILHPVGKGLSAAGKAVGKGIEAIRELGRLREENERLTARVRELEMEAARLKEADAENSRLRRLLSFIERQPFDYLPAEVIGRPPGIYASIVILNKGSNDGVRPGLPAVLGSELIGRVTAVSAGTCTLMLLTAPESSAAVMTARSRDPGIAVGTPGSRTGLRVKFFSPTSDVRTGDLVITSGTGSFFPKGLVVGEVSEVSLEEYGLVLYADVKPSSEIARLEEVFLIKASKNGG